MLSALTEYIQIVKSAFKRTHLSTFTTVGSINWRDLVTRYLAAIPTTAMPAIAAHSGAGTDVTWLERTRWAGSRRAPTTPKARLTQPTYHSRTIELT